MRKFTPILLFAGMVAFIGLVASIEIKSKTDIPARSSNDLEAYSLPRGKVLYVVVDSDGTYLGDQRIDTRYAKDAINALLRKEKIKNLVIYGTDLAKYGDVIRVYGGIEPTLVTWCTFSFRSVPIRTRMPLTGFLKPMCCGSIDIENEEPEVN